jgi:choline kinase
LARVAGSTTEQPEGMSSGMDTASAAGTDRLEVTILAAGMGTRLGRPWPKPLTPLADGRSILAQQVENVRSVLGADTRIVVVVGFKMELVMEALPDAVFVYNENYDRTNTSKSLLKALKASPPGGVLWMNGDVVFDPAVLARLQEHIRAERSVIAVNTAAVGEEEVKYTVDERGLVRELSKTVQGALGESVGINYVAAQDKSVLVRHLQACGEQDYFERGLETAIAADGLEVTPVDISDLFAVEVDFEEDLARANQKH